MDIDLSKVVLILLAVLPGYLARRGSDRVMPTTQREKGATEEIAEFLLFSATAHLILAFLYSSFWILTGVLCKQSALFFVSGWLPLTPIELLERLSRVPAGYLAIYLFLSLGIGWLLGLGRGLWDAWHVAEWLAEKLGVENSAFGRFWSKRIERFLITGRPIIYDALFPELDENGNPKDVFAELVMKEHQGSVTGTVTSFSIANDEESHKLVYLKDVYRKKTEDSQYEKLDGDGMLVDFADAITVQIKQV
jgi:hypothetical protein